MNTKLQVIIRRDLNLSPGALAAQVAHLSMEWFRFDIIHGVELTKDEKAWLKDPYLYVLAVDNQEELEVIITEAFNNNIAVKEWADVIQSENLQRAHKVRIGIVLGPDDSDKLKLITGNLPLY